MAFGQATPSPDNQIPKTRFDPRLVKLLEFWPAPNVNTSSLSNNYPGRRSPDLTDKDQFTIRSDFNESSNSQWFGRYSKSEETDREPRLGAERHHAVHHGAGRPCCPTRA